MNRNVTLRMDEDLLTELRHRAVDAQMSLSAWITSTLEERIQGDLKYSQARSRALKRLDQGLRLGGEPLTREQAHAR